MATKKFKYSQKKLSKFTPMQLKELLPGGRLEHGSHDDPTDGVCLMEAVAWVTNEPHSDQPSCADPAITSVAIQLNDAAESAAERNKLIRAIPSLVGSVTNSSRVRFNRMRAAACWVVKTAILDGLEDHDDMVEFFQLTKLRSRDEVMAARTFCIAGENLGAAEILSMFYELWDSNQTASNAGYTRFFATIDSYVLEQDYENAADFLIAVASVRR